MKKTSRKLILLCTVLAVGTAAVAQKSKLTAVQLMLQDREYKKAQTMIDEVVLNENTKDNSDAWFARSQVYFFLSADTTRRDPNLAAEARRSLTKTLDLNPKYNPNAVNPMLYNLAINSWNKGLTAFNASDFPTAYDAFIDVSSLYKMVGAATWQAPTEVNKEMTKLAGLASRNAAIAASNAGRDADAIGLYEGIRTSSAKPEKDIYIELLRLYSKDKSSDAKLMSTLKSALADYPTEKSFRDAETQYYVNSGNTETMIAKLEENKAKDPNNADYLFILGNTYYSMAFPANFMEDTYKKPANFGETFDKAEKNLLAAVAIKDEAMYNYNVGVLYYNQGNDFIKQMNVITGMSAAETKKYDALQAERDKSFAKALPFLEKSFQKLDGRSDLVPDDKATLNQSISALINIYSRQDNKTKIEFYKAKRDALSK